MDPAPRFLSPRFRRWLWPAAWSLGTILILLGLTAAFLPGYIKGVAIEQIRAQLHREASIESISVNPFLLAVRVRGLSVAEDKGKTEFFGFDELNTRVGLNSLLRRAPVIEELRIDRLRVHLARLAPERYNFTDIADALLSKPSSPGLPGFELNGLALNNASITFDDKPTGKLHKIEQIAIRLPVLSSFAADRTEFAEPELSAIVNGQPLELRGRSRPFDASIETTVDLNFANLDVPTYLAYSPVKLPLRLERGRLSTELALALVREKVRGISATLKGTVKLEDVVLQDPAALAGAAPIAAIRTLEARIAEIRWPDNSVRVDQITIHSPQVVLRRGRGGNLNWQEVFGRGAAAPEATPAAPQSPPGPPQPDRTVPPTNSASAPSTKSAPIRFTIAAAEITDGSVQFDDLGAPAGAFRAGLKSVAIRASGLSNIARAKAVIDSSAVSDAGEMHAHSATLVLEPFDIAAELSVKKIRLGRYKPYFGALLAADLDGTADLHALYSVGADFNVKVTDASLAVDGLALRDQTGVEIARSRVLAVTGAKFDLAQRSVDIDSISLRQCRAGIVRGADGGWNVSTLIKAGEPAPPVPPAAIATATAASPTTSSSAPEWSVGVAQAILDRCNIGFDDRSASATGAAKIDFGQINARFTDWSSRANARVGIDLKTQVNSSGRVAVRGTANVTSPAAELDIAVQELDLVPLQPYVTDRLNVRLTSGSVSTQGTLSVDAAGTSDDAKKTAEEIAGKTKGWQFNVPASKAQAILKRRTDLIEAS